MASAAPAPGLMGPGKVVKKLTGWLIVSSVLFIILGCFAIVEPAVAGLAAALLVGWLLIFGGVAHLIHAFMGGGAKHVVIQVLVGIIYGIAGFYCLTHPLLAVGALTLLLAYVILAGSVFEIVAYLRLKGESASGWILFNGLIGILLGGLIWFHWPSSSVWAIGTLVGVQLLMTGMTRLMLTLAARKLISAVTAR